MSFRHPVNQPTINNPFGANAAMYKQYGYKGHNGVDYPKPNGTAVYAADEGTIVFEGDGKKHSWMGAPAGICILINHIESHAGYAHLSSTIVNKGQKVKKGQLIGYVGATGAATGPHLHFEMLPLKPNFNNGYAGRINPSPYMDAVRTATADQVKKAYLEILERVADAGGIKTYTTNGMTIAQVKADLMKSAERKRLETKKAEAAKKRAEELKQKQQAAIAQAELDRIAKEAAEAEKEAKEKAAQYDDIIKANNALLKQILEIVQSIANKVMSIFK